MYAMKMTVEFIKSVEMRSNSNQALYKTDDKELPFIVVSGVQSQHVHEVMAFPADAEGEVTDWGEIACVRYTTSHKEFFGELDWKHTKTEDQ
tara:strand:+ start:2405 stop:2680 length:276 start_codon:yes stop_codon:yes gene_type:complete